MDKGQIQRRFTIYSVLTWLGAMLFIPLLLAMSSLVKPESMAPSFGLIISFLVVALLASVLFLISLIMEIVILYKTWRQIQHPGARWSPAAAVLPCLIPVVHLIWHFFCYVGLCAELNARLKRDGITGMRVNKGIAQTVCLYPFFAFLIEHGLQNSQLHGAISVMMLVLLGIGLPYLLMYQFYRASYAIAEDAEKPIIVPLSEPASDPNATRPT